MAVVLADFNNDGHDDMAVGAAGEDWYINGSQVYEAGAVNVIYGKSTGLNDAGDQIWGQRSSGIHGSAEPGDQFGAALAAGDFNGDGYADLAIGAPGEAIGPVRNAGAVNVIYGSSSGLSSAGNQIWHQNFRSLDERPEAFDGFGSALAVGDFDHDGYQDLAIGVPYENIGGIHDAGIVHLLRGTSGGLSARNNQIWHQDSASIEDRAERYDHFGFALTVGDFNGDDIDDLAVGVPDEDIGGDFDAGAVNVLYGVTHTGLSATRDQFWHQDSYGINDVSEPFDYFGSSLASVDFNNDGYDDLAIGVPGENDSAGLVNVIYGRDTGLHYDSDQRWYQQLSSLADRGQSGDLFGTALAAADFNSDGYADLAIGVPGEDVGSNQNAGAVHIIYSYNGRLSSSYDRLIHQDSSGINGTAQQNANFGTSLAAGLINNGRNADLIVGIPGQTVNGRFNAGAVHAIYGNFGWNFRTDNDQIWHQDTPGIAGGSESGDLLGGRSLLGYSSTDANRLNSNPDASMHLYLDFTGHWVQAGHGSLGDSISYTPAFDIDGNYAFNRTEQSVIQDAWAYVAEDFAPFDMNVTNVYPSPSDARPVHRVVIGGKWQDRANRSSSGWAFEGNEFIDEDDDNVVFVFSESIVGWSSNLTENVGSQIGSTISHEAGHAFGLGHTKDVDSTGAVVNDYSQGGTDWTPIMGDTINVTDRHIWTESSVAINSNLTAVGGDALTTLRNNIGLRADDQGVFTAGTNLGELSVSFGWDPLMVGGLIEKWSDFDFFSFRVNVGGYLDVRVDPADVGPNLDAKMYLRNVNDGFDQSFDSSSDNHLAAETSTWLDPGTYEIVVTSAGPLLGEIGHYLLSIAFMQSGDFNQDGVYGCEDIDALIQVIADGSHNAFFDLTEDGAVDLADRDAWLAEAGAFNLPSGAAYQLGDANLDGVVDVSDFNLWNGNKFTMEAAWCSGDFNADGVVDVSDFNIWNGNKFTGTELLARGSGESQGFETERLEWQVATDRLAAAAATPSEPSALPRKVSAGASIGADRLLRRADRELDGSDAIADEVDAVFATREDWLHIADLGTAPPFPRTRLASVT